MKLIEIRRTTDPNDDVTLVPERVARMLAEDRYLLRKFCAAHFGMQLHEDIVPIAEALDRSLDVCGHE